MSKLEIGIDVYNRTANRMGMVKDFSDTHVTVRSSHGVEVWDISDCDVMADDEFAD